MPVKTDISPDKKSMRICIDGLFDFNSLDEFRQAYTKLDGSPSRYVIDMRNLKSLDSSALGMLLLLREYVGGDRAQIRIENCPDDVKEMMAIAHFHKLFDVR